jgi:hypothetical protein
MSFDTEHPAVLMVGSISASRALLGLRVRENLVSQVVRPARAVQLVPRGQPWLRLWVLG